MPVDDSLWVLSELVCTTIVSSVITRNAIGEAAMFDVLIDIAVGTDTCNFASCRAVQHPKLSSRATIRLSLA
eukprot:2687753-Pleurochrysis_carterae.AAC.1